MRTANRVLPVALAFFAACTSASSSAKNKALVEDMARSIFELNGWTQYEDSNILVARHDLRQRVAHAESILRPWRADNDPIRARIVGRMSHILTKYDIVANGSLDWQGSALFLRAWEGVHNDLLEVARALTKPTPLRLTDADRADLVHYLGDLLADPQLRASATAELAPAEVWALRGMRAILRLRGPADSLQFDTIEIPR